MGATTYHIYGRILGNAIALLLHVGNCVAMFLAMRGDVLRDPKIAQLYASQFKYITVWNVAFQITYSIMSLACDIPEVLKVKEESCIILNSLKHVRKYRRTFFAGVVFPTSLSVFTVFWPVFIYDRELIFPAFIDKALSCASNHIMHSAIFPIVIWELIFLPRNKPRSHRLCLGHMAAIYFPYLIVLFTYYAERGTWPYPMFNNLYGTIYFPIVLAAVGIIYVLMYFAQWPLTAFMHKNCKYAEKIK